MNRLLTHIALIIMLSVLGVTLPAGADGKERDLADRVFEKYKQREEQKQRAEKQRGQRTDNKSQREQNDRKRSSNRSSERESRERTSRSRRIEEPTSRSSSKRESSRQRSTRERSTDSRQNLFREHASSRDSGNVNEVDLLRAARDLDRSLQRKREADRDRRDVERTTRQQRQERSRTSRHESRRSNNTRVDTSQSLSLDQAVAKVRRESGGRVLSATTSGQGSSQKHRIKVMIDERRVRTYIVDATTGKIY